MFTNQGPTSKHLPYKQYLKMLYPDSSSRRFDMLIILTSKFPPAA